MLRYSGLTWDHLRGYGPLRASAEAARGFGIEVEWEVQPLEGFESHPINELAQRYDLLILDHPHCGDIAASGSIRSVEEVFGPDTARRWDADASGASGASYWYAGQHWAAPLDAATQVSALLADKVATAPDTWEGALALAQRVPTLMPLAGPHPVLTVLSIAVAYGAVPGVDELLPPDAGRMAYETWAAVVAACQPTQYPLNPIGVLDAMSQARPDAVYCPLIYGYVTYSQPGTRPQQVLFAEAPAAVPGGRRGSTLGGTGLAITRRSPVTPELVDYCRWLISDEGQRRFIPQHGGQPALRSAWADRSVNALCGGFYEGTRATIEQAWVRPRFVGFTRFQQESSNTLREALRMSREPDAVVDDLNRMYRRYRQDHKEI